MTPTPDDLLIIEKLPSEQREALYHKLRAVTAVIERQRGSKAGEVRRQAADLGVSSTTLNRWIGNFQQYGITALIDSRIAPKTA